MNAKLLLNYNVTVAEETPRTLLLKCANFNGCFTYLILFIFFTHKVGSFFLQLLHYEVFWKCYVIILHH